MADLTNIQQGLPSSPAFVGEAPALGPSYAQPETVDAYSRSVDPLPMPSSPFRIVQFPYLDYGIRTTDYSQSGLSAVPVQGPKGTPVEIVRVHGGIAYKIVMFTGLRLGAQPDCPSADTGDPNDVLDIREVAYDTVMQLVDGTLVWSMLGCYVYFQQVAATERDRRTAGATPFSTRSPGENIVGPENFKPLLGPGPSLPNTPPAVTY